MKDKKSIPPLLWVALIGMFVFACIHLVIGFSNPFQLIAFVINGILLAGLYSGKKWAFVITIGAALGVPLALVLRNLELSFIVLVMNSVVLIPLLMTIRHFFPKNNKSRTRTCVPGTEFL